MVISQGETKIRNEGVDSATEILRTGDDRADTEDGALRQVDDRGEPLHSEASEIGDGERSGFRGQEVRVDAALAAVVGHLLESFAKPCDIQVLSMLHARDHKAALRVNRTTEIHDIEKPHGIAKAVRVHFRELLQGLDDSIAHKIVYSDVGIDLTFLVGFLGFLAESLDLAGVSSEHVCELCGVLERVVHALGDKLAHVGHLLDLEL